ncbi:hypothetical protein CISG_06165 [Coccidioides immitis RMSCC 3703]|uniref:Uncharacterized protein n=1 Tax=Coccidioides immitis RMSCC 3703 TaxID=454286 RepID=A0A0J8TTL8_COCIT|nr:hypothetical protein CISG_06165 [Coccidioides immitis RMSCC 3703]
MSTAVVPPTAALLGPMVDRDSSPKSYPSLAPLSAAPSSTPTPTRVPSGSNEVPTEKNTPEGKRSPNTSRSGGPAPKIAIKKEPPTSPSLQPGTRHRPRKLDLSTSTPGNNLSTRGPLTARDGRAMQDVGLACLSPGFQTQDPAMREQLQRSMNVRDQQRSIIEARLQQSAKGDGQESAKQPEPSPFRVRKDPSKKTAFHREFSIRTNTSRITAARPSGPAQTCDSARVPGPAPTDRSAQAEILRRRNGGKKKSF